MKSAPFKVLIVEDDERSGRLVSALVSSRTGWQVLWGQTLAQAREHLAQGPDAVLLDLKLAGESGEDIIDEIRDRCSECRIVVVTGLLEDSPRITRVRSKRPDAIMHKPYDIVGLMTALKGDNPFPE